MTYFFGIYLSLVMSVTIVFQSKYYFCAFNRRVHSRNDIFTTDFSNAMAGKIRSLRYVVS